jgi:hypothetical protein
LARFQASRLFASLKEGHLTIVLTLQPNINIMFATAQKATKALISKTLPENYDSSAFSSQCKAITLYVEYFLMP